jgi:SPP1 family predicted phage head-tail adaptor
MRAGTLDKRLTFQTPTESSDGQGGVAVSWSTTLATVWGSVDPLMGREAEQAAKLVATQVYGWQIRFSDTMSALTPKHRFTWNSRIFQILSAPMTEKRLNRIAGQAIEVTA